MNNFPFQRILDDEFLDILNANDGTVDEPGFPLSLLNELNFSQFDTDNDSPLFDIDPDNLLLNHMNIHDSKYYFCDTLSDIINNQNKAEKINILSYNVNSIPHNLENFLDTEINECISNVDIFAICETKLNDDIESLYNISNFKLYTNNRNRHGGGVALYISDRFRNHKLRNDLVTQSLDFESLFVEIENCNTSILCGSIYRPPNGNFINFIEILSDLLDRMAAENKKCYIMGDFNLNLLEYNTNNNVREMVSLFNSKYFYNTINKPTRVSSHSATIIDHLWTNDLSSNVDNGILFSKNSDHFPTISVFKSKVSLKGNKIIRHREINDLNLAKFRQCLEGTDWGDVETISDPSLQFDKFHEVFLIHFDQCFPVKNKTIKLKNLEKPYITSEIKTLIDEKNKLAVKYSKYPLTYGISYKSVRNKLNKMKKKAKDNYFKSKFDQYVNN